MYRFLTTPAPPKKKLCDLSITWRISDSELRMRSNEKKKQRTLDTDISCDEVACKGQSHEIFKVNFFHHTFLPKATDSHAKIFSQTAANLPIYSPSHISEHMCTTESCSIVDVTGSDKSESSLKLLSVLSSLNQTWRCC